MAAQLQIPSIAPFSPKGDPNSIAQRWDKWKKGFEYFILAAGIENNPRKRALLLHLMGAESQDIFETLPNTGVTYEQAITALDAYFSIKKNVPYERSIFHSAKQERSESIEQYVTRLRQLTKYCEYGASIEDHIRDQVIATCQSSKLRKKFLTEPDLTLDKLVKIGQLDASATHQNQQIDNNQVPATSENVNKLRMTPSNNRGRGRHRGTAHHFNRNNSYSNNQHRNRDPTHGNNHQYRNPSHHQPVKIMCGRCGATGHRGDECRRSRDKTCESCGKVGHFKRMCKTNQSQQQHQFSQKPRYQSSYSNSHKEHIRQIEQEPTTTPSRDQDEDSDEFADVYIYKLGKSMPTTKVTINNCDVDILIDSGATTNIIDEPTFDQISPTPTLTESKVNIYPYKADSPLKTLGEFTATVTANNKSSSVKFTLVTGNAGSLLSRYTAEHLDILRVGPPNPTQINQINSKIDDITLQEILEQNKNVFKGLGKLENFELKLHVNKDVTPIQQPIRRIPFHTQQKVSEELIRLQSLDIIEPVDGPTTWLNPVVVVPKSNGKTRLCLDMRKANTAVIRERHVIPKIEDILTELNGASIFSKIDLREGYHQILLAEESRHITAFATHEGVFRYKRLIYGISSAFESFQKQIEMSISGLKGVKNISDDIIIWASSTEEHRDRVKKLLQRLYSRGLRVNRDKCIFGVSEITFAGHQLSAKGIKPDQSKIDAIQQIAQPTNAAEVRSFLGLVNYCHRFIADFSTISEPLRRLTKKSQPFMWKQEQQKAFTTLKQSLINPPTLAYYNPDANTSIMVDASPTGLGAILSQTQLDGTDKPVCFGSRSLTDVESRYSQTEREALAAVWACEHYHYYVYDRPFEIFTDHKPLESLLSTVSNPPPRIQRWLLRIQAYRYRITYIPGHKNAADTLSRNPVKSTHHPQSIETEYIRFVVNNAIPPSLSLTEIQLETSKDPKLQKIIHSLNTNSGLNKSTNKDFYQIRNELSVDNGILLKGHCIVIPSKFRDQILKLAHSQHQGIVKCKALLRQKVWWPGINTDIEKFIASCHACQVTTPSTQKVEPLQMTDMPNHPWDTIAADIKGPFPTGENLLVLLDYRSRYPIVFVMKRGVTSQQIIKKLDKTFSMFGFPRKLLTDNGPQFISTEFRTYLKNHNVEHHTITPYWPQANGEVERFNRTIGKIIQCTTAEGKDWRNEIDRFLLYYRTTPHTATGVSPADMFLKHQARNDLPSLQTSSTHQDETKAEQKDKLYKSKIKQHADQHRHARQPPSTFTTGDTVLTKNLRRTDKTQPFYESEPVTITQVYPKSVKITKQGKSFIRSKFHIKKYFNRKQPQNQRKPTQVTEPSTAATNTYVSLVLFDNPEEENTSNTDSDSDNSTIPYAESDSETDTFIPKRHRNKPTYLKDYDTR